MRWVPVFASSSSVPPSVPVELTLGERLYPGLWYPDGEARRALISATAAAASRCASDSNDCARRSSSWMPASLAPMVQHVASSRLAGTLSEFSTPPSLSCSTSARVCFGSRSTDKRNVAARSYSVRTLSKTARWTVPSSSWSSPVLNLRCGGPAGGIPFEILGWGGVNLP